MLILQVVTHQMNFQRLMKIIITSLLSIDESHYIQKHGNLKRWGVKIKGVCIPYNRLSSDFINYYLAFGNPDDLSISVRKKKIVLI